MKDFSTPKIKYICFFVSVILTLAALFFIYIEYAYSIALTLLFLAVLNACFGMLVFIPNKNPDIETVIQNQIDYSYSHLTTIINNLPLMAYIIDTDSKFISGNLPALKFFGIKEDNVDNVVPEEIFEKDTLELMKEENEHIIQTKAPFVTDKIIKLKSGRQNWFKIRKVPILNSRDEVKGLVVFGRNIDVEKAAQKQRETYISTLSHDLKIPTLAQIRALELLVNGNLGRINNPQKEVLNLTLESCRCMYDMLSTILSTYKYENKDISLCYEKIQILKLLDECFAKFVKSMHRKNIKIKVRAKEKFFTVYADKAQLKKAFENLIDSCISNAYENTEIVCEIRKISGGKSVFLSLGFESPFLSTEKIQGMFERYATPSEKMNKVGCGLGLYLAKQIITAHHGLVDVESSESNYSVYNLELPCINECKVSAITC